MSLSQRDIANASERTSRRSNALSSDGAPPNKVLQQTGLSLAYGSLWRPQLNTGTLGRRNVSLSQAILDLENRNVGPSGEPTLGNALELAAAEWRSGNHDRELRLHLLFLCWYCTLEPPFLTGLSDSRFPSTQLPQLFQDVYVTFAGGILDDPEGLFIVGLMAQLAPWALGENISIWESRSIAFGAA